MSFKELKIRIGGMQRLQLQLQLWESLIVIFENMLSVCSGNRRYYFPKPERNLSLKVSKQPGLQKNSPPHLPPALFFLVYVTTIYPLITFLMAQWSFTFRWWFLSHKIKCIILNYKPVQYVEPWVVFAKKYCTNLDYLSKNSPWNKLQPYAGNCIFCGTVFRIWEKNQYIQLFSSALRMSKRLLIKYCIYLVFFLPPKS